MWCAAATCPLLSGRSRRVACVIMRHRRHIAHQHRFDIALCPTVCVRVMTPDVRTGPSVFKVRSTGLFRIRGRLVHPQKVLRAIIDGRLSFGLFKSNVHFNKIENVIGSLLKSTRDGKDSGEHRVQCNKTTRRMYRERSKQVFGDRRGQRWDIE